MPFFSKNAGSTEIKFKQTEEKSYLLRTDDGAFGTSLYIIFYNTRQINVMTY